jgi:hypothetical protein
MTKPTPDYVRRSLSRRAAAIAVEAEKQINSAYARAPSQGSTLTRMNDKAVELFTQSLRADAHFVYSALETNSPETVALLRQHAPELMEKIAAPVVALVRGWGTAAPIAQRMADELKTYLNQAADAVLDDFGNGIIGDARLRNLKS